MQWLTQESKNKNELRDLETNTRHRQQVRENARDPALEGSKWEVGQGAIFRIAVGNNIKGT